MFFSNDCPKKRKKKKSFQPWIFFCKTLYRFGYSSKGGFIEGVRSDTTETTTTTLWTTTTTQSGLQVGIALCGAQVIWHQCFSGTGKKITLYGNAEAVRSLLGLARNTKWTLLVTATLVPSVQRGVAVTSVPPTLCLGLKETVEFCRLLFPVWSRPSMSRWRASAGQFRRLQQENVPI